MSKDDEEENLAVAQRWCAEQGEGWAVLDIAGRGGTAPVFGVQSPAGERALKIYDLGFSSGERGQESERRLKPQLDLGEHDCPHIVKMYDGGRFEDRLFLLMSRAPGQELEKRLKDIPRDKIRGIIDQAARACQYLRDHELCHRDLKSANMFITDDFETATVLDLSVLRGIHDPIGIGTDQNGQLPVVATSRYSPPEYLFRLVEPSAELWHALDIYQLGGLLHDMIMREPMFEAEYRKSSDNRYRFAWVVATQDPEVFAPDVDPDLIILAKRALDKDWERRSALRLDDFLNESGTHRRQGLEFLGLTARPEPTPHGETPGGAGRRVAQLAAAIEEELRARLRASNVTATHAVEAGSSDTHKYVVLKWNPTPLAEGTEMKDIEFRVGLRLEETWEGTAFGTSLLLRATVSGTNADAEMNLPSSADGPDIKERLSGLVMTSLGDLASQILRRKSEVE